MADNLNRRVVGKCSRCGGVVSVEMVSMPVNRPAPSCERCGATADETHGLPVIPTQRQGGPSNRDFAATDESFRAACERAGVPPSKRQASKYRRKFGLAFGAK